MSDTVYRGKSYFTDDLIAAVQETRRMVYILEAIQYMAGKDIDEPGLGHIWAEMRDGIDDQVISDLNYYADDIQDATGDIGEPKFNLSIPALAGEIAKLLKEE